MSKNKKNFFPSHQATHTNPHGQTVYLPKPCCEKYHVLFIFLLFFFLIFFILFCVCNAPFVFGFKHISCQLMICSHTYCRGQEFFCTLSLYTFFLFLSFFYNFDSIFSFLLSYFHIQYAPRFVFFFS